MGRGSTISVVIPSCCEGVRLLRCIERLSRLRLPGEIVIAACDEPARLREQATRCDHLQWIDCETACRGFQLNKGAAAARGDVLLFLHADTELPQTAGREILTALADPAVVGGAFRLAFDASHPVLRLLSHASRMSITPAFLGDQGIFCRREAFETLGGFRELTLFEDVEFAQRLARQGRLTRLEGFARTSARRFVERGPWRQLGLNTLLFTLYHLGVPPQRLADVYAP